MGNTLEEAKSAPVRKWSIRTISFAETPTWCMNKIKLTKGLRATMVREKKQQQQQSYSLLLKNKITTMKILKIKLEHWLPGITIEATEPDSQLMSALNRSKLQVS